MRAVFRPLGAWPGNPTRGRRGPGTFRASWSDTLALLEDELDKLGAQSVVIQADFREEDIRLDGMPKANARVPSHPGVIISFESKHGPLQYATDAHYYWQHNVRAIALGLKALRAVDRYGITSSGEQYTGWRQLTAGSGVTSQEQALRLVLELTGTPEGDWRIRSDEQKRALYRQALKAAHPDHGGDSDRFAAVQDAGQLLGIRV